MKHTTRIGGLFLFTALMLCIPSTVSAQLQTARIFNSGMVLQRDVDIPVWGAAGAGDTIIVTLDAVSDTAFADEDGNWELSLEAMPAGGPYQMIISNGDQTFTRSNVYIGDVFMATGQSNMEMILNQADGGVEEASSANYESIRQFKVPKTIASEPSDNIPSSSAWTPATSSYAGNFSAVAYYFARDLQTETGVPIGIINTSYGGARIEAFMSDEMLGFDETWVTLANGENERQPTLIYNAMIHPLLKVPLKGILWYQGESNADSREDALAYGDLFKRMINAYRDLWNIPELPFLWVQLPNYGTPADENSPADWDAWPQLRAGQSRALSLPNTGEVITIDVGDEDIHPTNKEPVGSRLSLVARKVIYGEDIAASGPRYASHDVLENGRIRVKFSPLEGGLVATGDEADSLHWFSLADAEGNLFPAKAVLDGDSVLVWNDAVSDPAVLRYAWEYNPENVNFYSEAGLPASPFMIDVVYPGFVIGSFRTTDTILERGSSAVLTWKVYGASGITLNDVPIDSIGGMEVWPLDTISYTLRAVNRLDPEQSDSITLTINVIDPLPTIFIESDQGDLIEPDTEITITAEANAPGGGTVEQVEFFVDGVSIGIDTEAPYEISWTPPDAGEYVITAVVTNGLGVSVESDPIHVTVATLVLIIYEAEDAEITGGTVRNSSQCSGGQYVDLTDAFVLTFTGVQADTAGIYNMHIRYRLNYESPKTQNLFINDQFIQAIEFTAPNTSSWLTYKINVELQEGENKVEIRGVWNWMSFDYIALAVQGEIDTTDRLVMHAVDVACELNIAPNPLNQVAMVTFTVPESGNACFDIIDMEGRLVCESTRLFVPAGMNTAELSLSGLREGIYFLQLTHRDHPPVRKKMVVVR